MNVHMEEVDVVEVRMDDVEVVDVLMEELDMDDVEVIDVPMDEALAELEFADVFGVLQPDADEEEVSKHVVVGFIKKQNCHYRLYCSSDRFQR